MRVYKSYMATEASKYDGQNLPLPSPDPSTETKSSLGIDAIKPKSRKRKFVTAAAGGTILAGSLLLGAGKAIEDNANDNLTDLSSEHTLVLNDFSKKETELRSQLISPMQEVLIFDSLSVLRENHQEDLALLTDKTKLQEGYITLGNTFERSGKDLALGGAVILGAVGLSSIKRPSSPQESPQQDQTS